jgi:eukaryotic-like serine/threonine-protein kinase
MTDPTADPADAIPPERDGPSPLPEGADLERGYRVVGLLRRGAELDVYDVWSEERDCRCVAKTLRPDRIGDRGARGRLEREGRLLLSLTHPHLVRAYELRRGERPLLVLETLPGHTLARLIEDGAELAPSDLAHLGLQLCSAVGYLHRRGILHLDLKPSNVVAACGIARVLDLSVARPPGAAPAGTGTAGYAAPEQERGGTLGPAADVWGIGAVLFEAATGEPALDPGDEPKATDAGATVAPFVAPPPVGSRRKLPTALSAAIDACLAEDPLRRPAVAELSRRLASLV